MKIFIQMCLLFQLRPRFFFLVLNRLYVASEEHKNTNRKCSLQSSFKYASSVHLLIICGILLCFGVAKAVGWFELNLPARKGVNILRTPLPNMQDTLTPAALQSTVLRF